MKHPAPPRRRVLALGALALVITAGACSSEPSQAIRTEGAAKSAAPTTPPTTAPSTATAPAGAAEAALDATDRAQPIATSDETIGGAPSWQLYESTHPGTDGDRVRCITLEAPAPDPEIPTGTDAVSGVPLSFGTPEASAVSCTPVSQTDQSATLVVPTSGRAYVFSVSTAPTNQTALKVAHNDGSTDVASLTFERSVTASGTRWIAVKTLPLDGPDDSIDVVG